METAKQNQKFPFHFLSAPPTPPAENLKLRKENFWFLPARPKGADEARIIGRQDYQQNTFELRPVDTAGNYSKQKTCEISLRKRRDSNPRDAFKASTV